MALKANDVVQWTVRQLHDRPKRVNAQYVRSFASGTYDVLRDQQPVAVRGLSKNGFIELVILQYFDETD